MSAGDRIDKPSPLRLYVIRHGQTQWSLSGQYTGTTDIPLTAAGEDEARALGTTLRGTSFDHVFTSPRKRARQTSQWTDLSGVDGGPVVQVEADLAEWDYGDFGGRTREGILQSHPGWNLYRDGCPHGESPPQVLARADRLLARLRELSGDVALFTHGHFSGVLAARWLGLPVDHAEHFTLDTASFGILGYVGLPVVHQWNGSAGASVWGNSGPAQSSRPKTATQRWENEGGAFVDKRVSVKPPQKKLVVFDLDGTLAESKSAMDVEMAGLFRDLLQLVDVAVISGGDWPQFQQQIVSRLPEGTNLKGLSLLPTCGTKFYQHVEGWRLVYSSDFTGAQRDQIIGALKAVIAACGFAVSKTWGEVIEDRGSQITFSALGQKAPIEEKKKWDPDFSKRARMQALLDERIPDFSVRLGGTTSIDITKPGIDKAYGIRKLREMLGTSIDEMLFVGDALFPGGNDYAVKEAGVDSVAVRDSDETKRLIETMLACSRGVARGPATWG